METTERMTAGITGAGEGLNGIRWDILGQTYVPKQLCPDSFSWHATLPPGTMVPPHIHPTQDEFIYMLEGEIAYAHGDQTYVLQPGDSLYFDAEAAHGPLELRRLPAIYLSMIVRPES